MGEQDSVAWNRIIMPGIFTDSRQQWALIRPGMRGWRMAWTGIGIGYSREQR